ncbi:MAG TPA: FKBP-type peptidyl-prolyl cis-trans isomerase [Anaeromyxobacteraceae bacterium]|nr:FKBP-type peptidyl-prolyl cis-trans isomerase [Anaeromyxobacteraceae bacterium]
MRTLTALALALALAPAARAEAPKAAAPKAEAAAPAAKADPDKTLRAVGLAVAKSLEQFGLTPAELEQVLKGVREGAAGKVALSMEDQQAIQALVTERRAQQGEAQKKKGAEHLEMAAKEKGAVKTGSGLVYVPLKDGAGPSPAASDKVKVNYKGQLVDGQVFDASDRHGGPVSFPLDGVIPCWTEGVQKMKVGGKARLVCPPAIAYGDRGAGADVPPGATLDFEVELLEIVK